jgi:hypothetical protein
MTGTRPRTAWAARPPLVPSASALGSEQLAALVETELSRCDGVLFTATPREELDEIGRWQRLADVAWAGQARAIVAAHNRAGRSEREFLGCEVALALNTSTPSGEDVVATALLAGQLPGLLEAVEVGMLTVRHAYAVLGALSGAGLTVEQQIAVLTVALARYTGQNPAELGKLIARLILTVDAAAAAAREKAKTAERFVRFRAVEDGQGLIVARGPLAMVNAVRASLEATLPLTVEDGDERSLDARTYDLLIDLLTGGAVSAPGAGHAVVVVPFSVAAGGDLELAEIPGLGPVLPATARELLGQATTVTQVCVDPEGRVLAVSAPLPGPAASATDADPHRWLTDSPSTEDQPSWLTRLATPPADCEAPAASTGYRPSRRLLRYLEARDRTCTFPGCTRPARRTDKDHRDPWPRGSTSHQNLDCLCRRHHRAKHTVFTVERLPDGTVRWTTRGGWTFDRPPQGY